MRNLVLCLLMVWSSSVKGEEIKLSDKSKSDFLVGDRATILTEQSKDLFDFLTKNKVKLILEGNDLEYRIAIMPDSVLKWEFGIPSTNNVVGQNKNLIFDIGTNKQFDAKLNIYSKQPKLINYNPNIIYEDISEPQNLTFVFNNVSYVDKIEFIDKEIQIEGTNLNTISASDSYGFKSNPMTNTISINILPNNCENFDVFFYYTNKNDYRSIATAPIKLKIKKERKNLFQRFKISTNTTLYLDDFQSQKFKPKIIFDFENIGKPRQRYEIIQTPGIKIKILDSDEEFDMPDNNKVEAEISNIESSGIYDIRIKNKSDSKTFLSTLNILPTPFISEFSVANSPEKKIVKDDNSISALIIKGAGLHMMNDVQVELVNFSTFQAYALHRLPNIEENSINCQVKFDFASNIDIPVGKYYLRLSREIQEKQSLIKRIYPFYNSVITIEYPKKIFANQVNQIELYRAEYFKFKNDSLPKRYSNINGEILNKNSPIILEIYPNPESVKLGPQYIKMSAKYFKSNGTEVSLKITDAGNDYITIFNKPVYINLRDEFSLSEFNINEKIKVEISHSPEQYGSNKLSPVNEKTYYRGSNFFDKIGITLTIPPYLSAFRNVKRKTIIENANGDIQVLYDGDKELEFQSLMINAGLGFKYRGKNNDYDPSRFAIGFFLMGLDFANSSSIDEQKYDNENHNFIGRGSFNLMLLGEYSFLNLDNPNTRIPVYLGGVYIIDPIDGGSKFAPAFGFGIDIKLFGSN